MMLGWLAAGVALAGACAGVRGIRLLRRGLRHADDDRSSLDVIRGLRCVFLLEELYETGVVILILRASYALPSSAPHSSSQSV